MHVESLQNMQKALQHYIGTAFFSGQTRRVVDVGSTNVNGSYRSLFENYPIDYVGLDLEPGNGVDIVLEDAYHFPLEDCSADVVICGQMLEHSEYFWRAFKEMLRILSPTGYLVLIAPSEGPIHRYPVDCYRFYPDAFRALAKYADCHIVALWRDNKGCWKDLVGVFSKQESEAHKKPLGIAVDHPALEPGTHKYQYDVDLDGDGAAAQVIRMVGPNQRVLELGPGPGSITKVLQTRNSCHIDAVELDDNACETVAPYCEHLIQADLNDDGWLSLLPNSQPYDVIVAADVLEHLYAPERTLKGMASLISEDGAIVISLPHVAHASVLGCLTQENFEYRNTGLLDRTHLRFFGLHNIQSLVEKCGLKIVEAKFVVRTPEQTEFASSWRTVPPNTKRVLLENPFSLVYQVVVRAVKAAAPEAALSLMDLPVMRHELALYAQQCSSPAKTHISSLIEADRAALLGDTERAISLYWEALEQSQAPAFIFLRLLELMTEVASEGELIELCKLAAPECEKNAALAYSCARTQLRLTLYDSALTNIEHAIKLDSRDFKLWMLKGQLLNRLHRWNEASECLLHAQHFERTFALHLELGETLLKSGNRVNGEHQFSIALELAPTDEARAVVFNRHAHSLLHVGDRESAQQLLQQATELTTRPEIHVALARLLKLLGRRDEGIRHLKNAITRGINIHALSKALESL